MFILSASLSLALGAAPTCAEAQDAVAELIRFRQAVQAVDDSLWPGWDVSTPPTGVVLGGSWVAWLSAPDAPSSRSCDPFTVGRAGWVHRALRAQGGPALAQIDTRRRPALAILTDPAIGGWQPRDWMAIYAHELFHVHQFGELVLEDLSEDVRRLHRAWARQRALIEPTLHAQLRAGWEARSGDASALAAYLDARRATDAQLAAIDPDLPGAAHRLELLEGVARFIELRIEIDPRATESLGGPRDEDEALQANALSFQSGRWWYATGFTASWLLHQHHPGWRQRIFSEGLDPLLEALRSGPPVPPTVEADPGR